MGIPDGAHTHGSGGSGLGSAVLVILGAALAVRLAGPVVAAAAGLLHVLLIAAGVIVGLGAASLVGLLAWRWRLQKGAARAIPPVFPSRGPPSRCRRNGERANYPANRNVNYPAAFIFTSTACQPRTSPPSSPGRIRRGRR
jgi:hypothetical protein